MRAEEREEQGAQKPPEPLQEEAEVIAGGGEDGVGAVAIAALEAVAAHAVVLVESSHRGKRD